jgi:hypothetical protein
MNSLEDRVKQVNVTEDTLTVDLMDGRSISVPLVLYPTLVRAAPEEREDCAPIGAGYGIEWPRLDYHLSVRGILQGTPEAPGFTLKFIKE